jgi:decaprenyl-phosphate phosphoribosyltransferase
VTILPYIKIARPDHWVKNVFLVPGILLAFFLQPGLPIVPVLALTVACFACACLIASSNYVLNEILDAPHDRHHPEKRFRPVPSGEVKVAVGYALWIGLAVVGVGLSFWISVPFALSGLALWVMGVLYNVPPVRMKDKPYTDVLSESITTHFGWPWAGMPPWRRARTGRRRSPPCPWCSRIGCSARS